MKIQLETKSRTIGLEIDVEYFKNKFKKIFKNLLTIIGTLSLCLLCSIEVDKNTSLGITALIYLTLLGLFVLGVLAIDNEK